MLLKKTNKIQFQKTVHKGNATKASDIRQTHELCTAKNIHTSFAFMQLYMQHVGV